MEFFNYYIVDIKERVLLKIPIFLSVRFAGQGYPQGRFNIEVDRARSRPIHGAPTGRGRAPSGTGCLRGAEGRLWKCPGGSTSLEGPRKSAGAWAPRGSGCAAPACCFWDSNHVGNDRAWKQCVPAEKSVPLNAEGKRARPAQPDVIAYGVSWRSFKQKEDEASLQIARGPSVAAGVNEGFSAGEKERQGRAQTSQQIARHGRPKLAILGTRPTRASISMQIKDRLEGPGTKGLAAIGKTGRAGGAGHHYKRCSVIIVQGQVPRAVPAWAAF